MSKLYFGVSSGYGNTSFRHKLDSFGIVQQLDSLPQIFHINNPAGRFTNWTNDVANSTFPQAPGAFTVSSDTAKIGFRSKTLHIPLKATVHVEFNRYRIGGGYAIDYTRFGAFRPISYADNIAGYSLNKSSIFLKHYFGMIGAMVYRYEQYVLVVDANIGGYSLGKSFAKEKMSKSLYFNLGATAEREFSENFRVFIRPSYEIKSYKLTIPESSQTIRHRMDGFYVNAGITYRMPALRRCFLKSCHAQINHAHGNREYRSRRHPIHKKQNPHYGENYPVLIKYKGKNKKKLNPY